MNYAALVTAIQDYCENTESTFVTHIPDFVKHAEERIYREVQLQSSQVSATSTFTSSSPYLALPSDFWSPLEFSVTSSGVQYFLYPKEVSFIRAAYPSSSTTGRPRYYALFSDATLIVGPTPDQNYVCELHYLGRQTSIVSASTTWLGTNGEQVLLYGSLVNAAIYMKDDADIIKNYEDRYQEALVRLKVQVEGQNRKDSYKEPEPSVPSV